MNFQAPILTIIAALNCEAKPWIDFYGLKKTTDKPFSFYSKEGVNIEIVITGIGSLAMSTAVGWVAGSVDSTIRRVWLNIGIAGHERRSIGEIVRVHAYIDGADLRHYYSPLIAKWVGDSDALMSVNAPTSDYPDGAMVDMEGVAFYLAASLFSSGELIESVKVISDNQQNSVEGLNASKITQLMQPHVSQLNQFTDNLLALGSSNHLEPIELELSDVRATHSQRQQLKRLLEKASALELHASVSKLSLSNDMKIDSILNQLRTLVDNAAPSLSNSVSNSPSATLGAKHG